MGKREAILAAAGHLFGTKGYEATTMDEIAAAVPVAKATLYRYFPSKEALRHTLAPHLPGADLEIRDVRRRILEAAMGLMARQGFARTSLEEIAAAAGVSRSAIYWHFKSKDDLITAIIADYTPVPHIAELAGEADDLPFEELIRRVYAEFARLIGRHIDFFRAAFVEVQTDPELSALFLRNVIEPVFTVVGGALLRGMADGTLRPAHPVLALQALMAPLMVHLMTRELLATRLGVDLDLAEVQEVFLRILLDGLRASDPSPPAS